MKKSIFMALFAVLAFCFKAQAQSSLLATLNHDGEISIFYGATALQQAHAAATHGDVITMSSGTFASVDITKAVTIRGAGMSIDTVTHTEPTVLSNNFFIDITDTIADRLTMEGIYTNQKAVIKKLKNALFLKSRFNTITHAYAASSVMKDLTFIHCRISLQIEMSANSSASFINSVINGIHQNYGSSYCSLINCYTKSAYLNNSEYKNCIIDNNTRGSNTATYYNNLHIGDSPHYTLTELNNTNKKISIATANSLHNNYSDDNQYILTEELKALIKGTDGTEVGIHGGSLPYDATPSNPQISKFNVAAKSTADGKLSVDIEVSSAD